MFLDFTNWQVSNNLNLLEVFFWVNSFYSLKYTGSSLNIYNTDVAEKYREKWADYSNKVMNPIMKNRYFQLHLGESKLSLDFEEKVKKNIILLEQEILCKNEI